MKKIVFIALLLIVSQVNAQQKQRANKERGEKMERFSDMTPDEIATLQTKKMTLHLDLNESQQKEIKKLNVENAKSRKAKMEAFKAQKENGDMQKPSKEERLKRMNERLDNQIEMKAKMKKILNDEQYDKWEKSQERMKNKNERMPKRKGQKQGQRLGK